MKIEEAARAYVESRKTRQQAKDNLREFSEANGQCDGIEEENGPCYLDTNFSSDEWCELCQGKQPFYLARKAAGIRVAVTLRALSRLCNYAT